MENVFLKACHHLLCLGNRVFLALILELLNIVDVSKIEYGKYDTVFFKPIFAHTSLKALPWLSANPI